MPDPSITDQNWVPEVREDGVYLVGADDGTVVLKLCRPDRGSDLWIAGYISGLQVEAKRKRGGVAMAIPKDAREIYFNDAYCPVDGIGMVDVARAQFWAAQDHGRMRELVIRAQQKTRAEGTDFAVICIDVDDPVWRPLVDGLMPNHDWDVYRARGETPVARGVVPRDLIAGLVRDFYPAAGELPTEHTPIGVFAAGGIALYTVEHL